MNIVVLILHTLVNYYDDPCPHVSRGGGGTNAQEIILGIFHWVARVVED